jgi:dethiobiotin synthetase
MSRKVFFVTGTDTGVGKTLATVSLLRAFAAQGKSTLGLKPVAAGCEETGEGLRNEDALALMEAASVALPYEQVNPVALSAALAPHIAAALENRRVRVTQVVGLLRGAMMQARADITLIEGAGGWRVPLNEQETLADLAREMKAPVILVVGLRLGCINHALLTAEAIRRDGLVLAGWVANTLDPDMPAREQNIATLASALAAPCLGVLPFVESADRLNEKGSAVLAAALDTSLL